MYKKRSSASGPTAGVGPGAGQGSGLGGGSKFALGAQANFCFPLRRLSGRDPGGGKGTVATKAKKGARTEQLEVPFGESPAEPGRAAAGERPRAADLLRTIKAPPGKRPRGTATRAPGPATTKAASARAPEPAPEAAVVARARGEARLGRSAADLATKQRDISVSEFFAKNRHLLGFDNPSKALLTTVREAVDNSLDACEEAGILPDLHGRDHPAGRRALPRGRTGQRPRDREGPESRRSSGSSSTDRSSTRCGSRADSRGSASRPPACTAC